MKSYSPLAIIISLFLLLKLSNLGIRMSDTNIYFYTAYQLLEGKILYKDIFFTNFPLFPYVSVIYFFLTFKQLTLYFLTSSIETSTIAGLLYYLSFKHSKSQLISTISTSMYLFSFIVLSTSDHQTGVSTASLFALLSYVFMQRKQFILTGIFITCAVLTKAYFLPILMSIGLYLLLSNRHALIKVITASILTTGIILLPTLLFARNEFMYQVFNYSLTRSQGIDKGNILWFFITHDLLFFLLFLTTFIAMRKHLFFFIVSVFSLLFIFLYQDLYFLYLNFFIPFVCLFFMHLYSETVAKLPLQKMVIPSIIGLLLLYNFTTYMIGFRNLQKIPNFEKLTQTITALHPAALYGVNDTTPAVAYTTNIPLLNNIVDTNENIFRKGYLNATQLTSDAIRQKALFITHGASYPTSGIEQPILNEIFDITLLEKHDCKMVGSFPVLSEGVTNRLNLISCSSE